jgi:pimeloyl-ACP methyl ester carboxylesterase
LFSIWLRGVDDDELKCFIPSDMGAYGFDMWARAAREIEAAYRRWGSPLGALAGLEATLPVLHLYAQPDEPGYLAAQQAFAVDNPWYSAVKLNARSHFPMFEVPREMSAEVERFIAPTRRPSPSTIRVSRAAWVSSLPL